MLFPVFSAARRRVALAAAAAVSLSLFGAAPASAQSTALRGVGAHAAFSPAIARSVTASAVSSPFTQSTFYVGGKYVNVPGVGTEMDGAMYVTEYAPAQVLHRYPIVLIHGAFGAGGAWNKTPDGRDGWAPFFARKGFTVYAVDQPARGRSVYNPNIDGPMGDWTTLQIEQLFTAPEAFDLWPQAHLHTQWPSSAANKGQQGDPVFDTLMRGGLNTLTNAVEVETLNRAAGAALLDKIGPAIVFGRSQGGTIPFLYADARPGAVKAMVDIEGAAPALNCYICGATPSNLTPAYGLTTTPLTYSPAITAPTQLTKVIDSRPDGSGLATCWKQGGTIHTLTRLQGIPTMVMVSQASFAAQNQQCTSQYLTQAGVTNDFVRLEDFGIYGNGHLMNIERNSDQVAALMWVWLLFNGF